jgi:hypothetical protein
MRGAFRHSHPLRHPPMSATDEFSRQGPTVGARGKGSPKISGSNWFKRLSPHWQSSPYEAPELIDASYDRMRNDQGLSAIALMSLGDMSCPWKHPRKRHDSWKHRIGNHGGRSSARCRDRAPDAPDGRYLPGCRSRRPPHAARGCTDPKHLVVRSLSPLWI